jgi:hypothetical protein
MRIWRWSKRNPRFAGALAASIVLAMLNLLAIFAISHLLSIVGHTRLAHRTVVSVQFQDLHELTRIDAAPSSAEKPTRTSRARAARQGTEM